MKKLILTSYALIYSLTGALYAKTDQVDHLKMEVQYEDSTLSVNALYKTELDQNDKSIYFMLNPGFNITEITAPGLDTFYMAQKPGSPIPFWKLDFQNFQNDSELSGKIKVAFKYTIDLAQQNHMRSNWIELNVDKFWFPNKNNLDNMFTYDVTIKDFPKEYSLVSTTDTRVYYPDSETIRLVKSVPDEEVLILAGNNMEFWNSSESREIRFFTHSDTPDSLLQSMNKKVNQSIEMMNNSFGQSNPLDTFLVVLRNTSSKEIGFQFSRDDMIITGPDFDSYGNLSHEIAHYWWSKADFIQEPWMNESFANFAMFRVMEKYSPSAYEKLYNKYLRISESAPPVSTATLFSKDSYNSYYIKGSILLKQLESMIGRESMNQLLLQLQEKNITSTHGFLDELEAIAGTNNRNDFEQIFSQ